MNQQPFRVLQVVTYMGRGGIETMLMNYYRHIDRTKIQFDFLVHREFRADFDDEIEAMGGRIFRISPMNPLSVQYRRELSSFFESHSYPVVHCHLNYKSGIILEAAQKAGVPVRIAHAHTAMIPTGWQGMAKKIMKKKIPHTANCFLACGEQAGRILFGTQQFCVMANAIDLEAYRYTLQIRTKMRENLQLGNTFTLVHVGRMDEDKNQNFLLDMLSQMKESGLRIKLLLVGDGSMRKQLEEKVNQLSLQNQVVFLGVRSDVGALLQAADCFTFPSRVEGLPVTLIEAQAAGLPCIMSDQITKECVLTDLVQILPITDPKIWADAIMKLDRSTIRTDHSAEIAAGGYDIVTAAKKLEKFYLNGEPL